MIEWSAVASDFCSFSLKRKDVKSGYLEFFVYFSFLLEPV